MNNPSIIIAKNAVAVGQLYIQCDQVLYFRDNHNEKNTRGEIHLANGEILYTKETASGINELMACLHNG